MVLYSIFLLFAWKKTDIYFFCNILLYMIKRVMTLLLRVENHINFINEKKDNPFLSWFFYPTCDIFQHYMTLNSHHMTSIQRRVRHKIGDINQNNGRFTIILLEIRRWAVWFHPIVIFVIMVSIICRPLVQIPPSSVTKRSILYLLIWNYFTGLI